MTASARSLIASLPRPATRMRTSENQMSMFTVISVGAIAFMMLMPSPRAAFASVEPDAHAVRLDASAPKAGRIILQTETDRACAGQAWGSEDMACILAIARDSGRERTIRFADAGLRQ